MPVTITLRRPVPTLPGGKMRPGWARDQECRVLAGCYEKTGPGAREVYVREQVGHIEGWSYCEWDGDRPVAVRLYVRVQD
jgi:hypothetical protein